jgi:hypothetical protein
MRQAKLRHWKDAIDLTKNLTGTDVSPTATMSLLLEADQIVLDVAMMYSQPALMFEGNTAGLESRRFSAIIPPGSKYAKFHYIRCYGTGNTPWTVTSAGTDTGGFVDAPGADATGKIVTSWLEYGTETYLETTSPVSSSTPQQTAEYPQYGPPGGTNPVPFAMNRAANVPEALRAGLEEMEIVNCAGVSVCVFGRSPNLELL